MNKVKILALYEGDKTPEDVSSHTGTQIYNVCRLKKSGSVDLTVIATVTIIEGKGDDIAIETKDVTLCSVNLNSKSGDFNKRLNGLKIKANRKLQELEASVHTVKGNIFSALTAYVEKTLDISLDNIPVSKKERLHEVVFS